MPGNTQEPLRLAFGRAALGTVLVAARGADLCAVFLGDDQQEVLQAWASRVEARGLYSADGWSYGGASDATLRAMLECVLHHIEYPAQAWAPDRSWPLRPLPGTSWQERVWRSLQAVPCGSTTSYSALARALGEPHAARAVGRACAANPMAILIPCHRVIRHDGALGGYRWGLARKHWLLQRERVWSSQSGSEPAILI